jgi:hypothetical protein
MAYRQGSSIVGDAVNEVTLEDDEKKNGEEKDDPDFDAAAKTSIKPEDAEAAVEPDVGEVVNVGTTSAAEILASGAPDALDELEDDLEGLEG